MSLLKTWYALVFPALILLHLGVAPFTKVEESFNIQAIHDILRYGVPVSNAALKLKSFFDHMTFSGSVPRTFIGAMIIAFFVQPLGLWTELYGVDLQMLARAVLGLLNAAALMAYTRAVRTRYGNRTAMWFTAFQASQFHIIYYSSRTLPNMFAFCLSTFALAAGLADPTSALIARRNKLCLYLLTLSAVIFRSELVLLLGSLCLNLLIKAQGFDGRARLIRTTILPPVIAASLVGVFLTGAIDTYFWQSSQFLWPEASAFLFNVFPTNDHTGASAWGTSPWYWYFVSAIPRLLLSPGFLLLPYGILSTPQRNAILDQLSPSLLYTALYSFLPHKETRFLFPIVPQLTLAMALTASYISLRRQILAKCVTGLLVISTIVGFFISHAVLLPFSAQSYPGAEALYLVHNSHFQKASDRPQINVYLTNLALQTGITRFLEQPVYANTNSSFESRPAEKPSSLVMPGSPDGKYPSLTYYPKSSSIPIARPLAPHERPLWTYEKVAPEDGGHGINFWNRFDYAVVEDPSEPLGSWEQIGVATSLSRSRPRITRYQPGQRQLLVLGRGSTETGERDTADDQADEGKDLYELLFKIYGRKVAWLYAVVYDVMAGGYGTGGRGVTGGRWVRWGLEPRLYILGRKNDVGVLEIEAISGLSHSIA